MGSKDVALIFAGYGPAWEQQLYSKLLAGRAWIAWVARRLTECQHVHPVWVIAKPGIADEVRAALPGDIGMIVDEKQQPLAESIKLAEKLKATGLVRVLPENPFIDAGLVDRLVTSARSLHGCDYATYVTAQGEPVGWDRLGISAEWCLVEALEEVARKQGPGREDFTNHLFGRSDKFTLRLLQLPEGFESSTPCRGESAMERWEAQNVIAEALQQHLRNDDLTWDQIARAAKAQGQAAAPGPYFLRRATLSPIELESVDL